jgi:hypothetical protein
MRILVTGDIDGFPHLPTNFSAAPSFRQEWEPGNNLLTKPSLAVNGKTPGFA